MNPTLADLLSQGGLCSPSTVDMLYQQWAAQGQQVFICIHSNCPICQQEKEEKESYLIEYKKKQMEEQEQKKKEYQKRCSDFLKYFRGLKVKK